MALSLRKCRFQLRISSRIDFPASSEMAGLKLVSTASLSRDQCVRSRSSHAAFETTQPTALPSAGRSQLLRTNPALWAGASVGLAACNCLCIPAPIRFQESRMPGNPLVRFDEGRVGRITSVALSPTLPSCRYFASSIAAIFRDCNSDSTACVCFCNTNAPRSPSDAGEARSIWRNRAA